MEEYKLRAAFLGSWGTRMATKYGTGIVRTTDGKSLSWLEAITRATLGPDWNNMDLSTIPAKAITIAEKWERGEVPDWVESPKNPAGSVSI